MLFPFNDLDNTMQWMNDLHRRLDRALGTSGLTDAPRATEVGWVDLEEDEEGLVLRADLPGVTADALEITLRDEVLTLAANRAVSAPEGYRAQMSERRPFEFSRSFSLPTRVDPERVNAKLKDGVLIVRMAKAEAVKPRQITVDV